MPSGGITITPGYQLAPGERVNNTKLNQLGQPVGQVDEGAITDRELAASINLTLSNVRGNNLFCNGDFRLWIGEELGYPLSVSGLTAFPALKHDYLGPARWVTPNDANRTLSRQNFTIGQTEVPDSLPYFNRWVQGTAIAGINPTYIGQRLENVAAMSGRTVTLSIWVRAASALILTPSVRQFFGSPGGSADVVQDGTPVTLVANVWKEIKETFTIGDVTGKTITNNYDFGGSVFPSFTEFRLVVPQAITFTLDTAHAMLSAGTASLGWDDRLPYEDYLFASRYGQVLGMILSDNILTHGQPFVNLRVPTLAPLGYAGVFLHPFAGTGATIGFPSIYQYGFLQATNHTVISNAYVIIDSELHAPA